MNRPTQFLAVLCLLLAAPLFASGSLTLSPAVITLRGELGQSTTRTFTIDNSTSQDAAFEIEVKDVVTRDGARVFVPAGQLPGSIAATAVVSPRTVPVASGQSASVSVTVTLPRDTVQRAVVVHFRATKRMMSGNVPVFASLGGLMTFTVSEHVSLTAASPTVHPQSASSNLSLTQECSNTGTEPFTARGVLAILDESGSLVGRAPIDAKRLLPAERTTLSVEYPGELAPGRYRLLVTYDLDGGRPVVTTAETEVR